MYLSEMTRVEGAYAVKLKGQILAHSVRTSSQEVFDEFSKFLSLGGKIVEVNIAEMDERPCFKPTLYLYSNTHNTFYLGEISHSGEVSQPAEIPDDHPIVEVVRKASKVKSFTYDSIFLVDFDHESRARMAISFNITEDGDTTTVSKVVQKKGIQPIIHGFLDRFNF